MDKSILGLSEQVTVQGTNGNTIKLIARIVRGATSSSIDSGLAKTLELGPVLHLKTVKSASGVKKREIMKVNILLKEINLEEERFRKTLDKGLKSLRKVLIHLFFLLLTAFHLN